MKYPRKKSVSTKYIYLSFTHDVLESLLRDRNQLRRKLSGIRGDALEIQVRF